MQHLMLATPEAGSDLLPTSAARSLDRLFPCDVLCVAEIDDTGFLLRERTYPAATHDYLGPRVCDGPVTPGLQHLATFPQDDEDVLFNRALGYRDTLRLGFVTTSGTVVQLCFDRRDRLFTERDVALLRLVGPLLGRLVRGGARLAHADQLSPSESRVLELVAAGGSNRDVAEQLSVSVATVRKHLEHSYRKLGVGSRTAAVAALTTASPTVTDVDGPEPGSPFR